jgi:release factor glutamine methyltransferase
MNIYDIREAINITDWVVESITGIKRMDRVLKKETELNDITANRLLEALEQLLQNKPVQYV